MRQNAADVGYKKNGVGEEGECPFIPEKNEIISAVAAAHVGRRGFPRLDHEGREKERERMRGYTRRWNIFCTKGHFILYSFL